MLEEVKAGLVVAIKVVLEWAKDGLVDKQHLVNGAVVVVLQVDHIAVLAAITTKY